jgi:hypothetical protein
MLLPGVLSILNNTPNSSEVFSKTLYVVPKILILPAFEKDDWLANLLIFTAQ